MKLQVATITAGILIMLSTTFFYVSAFKTELERVDKYTRQESVGAGKFFGDTSQPNLFLYVCPFH